MIKCFINVIWIFEFDLNSRKEITFKFEILIEIKLAKALFAQLACWPPSPTGPFGLGLAVRLGSGSNHRPSPAPHSRTSSSSRSLWWLDRRRRRLAAPANPGDHRRCHLGRITRPSALFRLHRTVSSAASSPRRSMVGSHSENRPLPSPISHPAGSFHSANCASPRRPLCVWHAGGSVDCGIPSGTAVKSSLGRAWSAARALPRHAGQVCTWATGESLLLLLSTLCSSQWTWSLTMLVRISEPSSQIPPLWCYLMQALLQLVVSCWISGIFIVLLSLSFLPGHALWPIGQEQWAKLIELALCCCCWMHTCLS
jgi:hypothetical protein